jgi:hypothetical protein
LHHGGGDRNNATSRGALKSVQSDAAGEVSAGPASIAGRVTARHVKVVFGGKSDNGLPRRVRFFGYRRPNAGELGAGADGRKGHLARSAARSAARAAASLSIA